MVESQRVVLVTALAAQVLGGLDRERVQIGGQTGQGVAHSRWGSDDPIPA